METSNKPKDIQERTALIYARVSTKGQDPRAQIHRCKEYCNQLEIKIEHIFEDKFTGGGDFMERPAMKQLIAHVDARPHKKYVIVFDDIKRMSRDVEFHFKLRRELSVRDVVPLSPNYTFGESPEDRLMEGISALQADVERLQNRRQVIQKMKARLDRGYWPFGSLSGYIQTKDALHGKLLIPKEPDFSLIKEALEGYASGRFQTQQEACDFLTKSDYKGRGRKIYPTHFKEKLAQQVAYAGYIEYPAWEVTRVKGHHRAAISLETFEKIQEKLKGNANTHYRTDNDADFPLRGFLVCEKCNIKLTASWSKGRGKPYPYYKCRSRFCESYGKSIRKEEVHGQFGEILNSLKISDEVVEEIKQVTLRKWEERMKKKDKEFGDLQKELSRIDDDINQYLEMAKDARSDAVRRRYEKSADDLISRQQVLEERVRQKPRDRYQVGNAFDAVIGFLKVPYTTWEKEDLSGRRLLLRLIFDDCLECDIKEGVGNAKVGEIVSVFKVIEKPPQGGSQYVEMAGIEPACE